MLTLLVQQRKGAEAVSRHPLLLVAAADSSEGLPPTIRRCFTHEISMGPLTEEQRVEMLAQSLHHVSGLLPNVGEHAFIYYLLMILNALSSPRGPRNNWLPQ